jgi:S1-C subfamily serine protease
MKYLALVLSILCALLIAGARGGQVQRVQPSVDLGATGRFEFRVTRVEPGSPAEEAGLRPGDIVKRLDKRLIQSPEDLKQFGMSHVPGEIIEIRYERAPTHALSDEPKGFRTTVTLRAPSR